MTVDEFQEGMSKARREDGLFWVANDETFGIAVGLDSGRGVAILHTKQEVPLADLRAMTPP